MHALNANSSATGACDRDSYQHRQGTCASMTHHDEIPPPRSVPRPSAAAPVGIVEATQQERCCKKQRAEHKRSDAGLQRAVRMQSQPRGEAAGGVVWKGAPNRKPSHSANLRARRRMVSSRRRSRQQRTHQRHEHAAAAYDRRVVSAQPKVGACRASRGEREASGRAAPAECCLPAYSTPT